MGGPRRGGFHAGMGWWGGPFPPRVLITRLPRWVPPSSATSSNTDKEMQAEVEPSGRQAGTKPPHGAHGGGVTPTPCAPSVAYCLECRPALVQPNVWVARCLAHIQVLKDALEGVLM